MILPAENHMALHPEDHHHQHNNKPFISHIDLHIDRINSQQEKAKK